MKRLFAILISALLCMSLIFCVSAAAEPERLVDNADILTPEEEAELTAMLDEISEKQKFDVVIMTTTDLDGQDILEYAEDVYEAGGYRKNGMILVRLAGENPQYGCLALGKGNKIFDDDAMLDLRIVIEQYLHRGETLAAFEAYAETCEEKVEAYVPAFVIPLVVSIGLGILLAFLIPMKSLKRQLKSVRMQPAAASYVRPESMNLTNNRDIFLYRTVTRTEKPKNNNSNSSGGSSGTRTTSSGNRGFSGNC